MSEPDKAFAVVVGIEKYDAGSAWDLDGPANDAVHFVEWLRKSGVPKERILLFLSPLDANKPLIQKLDIASRPAEQAPLAKALTDSLSDQAGDVLFFFWGGHGAIDAGGNRRLFYADATQKSLRHLVLNNLLKCWRTDYLKGFPQQIVFVDACANFLEYMRAVFTMPEETYPTGMPIGALEQFVLLAASPGELAQNRTAVKSGRFSELLLEQLRNSDKWPPDLMRINQQLLEQFAALRDAGEANQTPGHFWYRDWQGNEGTLGSLTRAQVRAGPPINQQLDVAERKELVSALLGCEVLTDRESRIAVISDLRKEIRQNTREHPSPQMHVDDLVRTAMRYPGGLKELIHVIRNREGPTFARQELEGIIKRLMPSLL